MPPEPSCEALANPSLAKGRQAQVQASMRFEEVYDEHFAFVWRTARRLGIRDSATADVVQEAFLVVHRRLAEFEARSSVRTWLYGIVRRVVHGHRRTAQRKDPRTRAGEDGPNVDTVADGEPGPEETVEQADAVRLMHRLLDELDLDKREVLVLAELEQMSVPEIAEATGENVNTVYSRLRAARRDFEMAVTRFQSRDGRRLR